VVAVVVGGFGFLFLFVCFGFGWFVFGFFSPFDLRPPFRAS